MNDIAPAPAALRDVLKGRKTWKTLPGDAEPVWPPELEAALIEGLERYAPDESRETRHLRRFPRRNLHLAEYIFNTTGKVRTAKQVGSRLQQLKDTVGDKNLTKLMSHGQRQPLPYPAPSLTLTLAGSRNRSDTVSSTQSTNSSSSNTFSDISTTTSSSQSIPTNQTPVPTIVNIHLLPRDTTWVDLPSSGGGTAALPRPLEMIDPTMTFISPTPIDGYSYFSVFIDGEIVHTELTPLTLLSNGCTGVLYTTALAPGYWTNILESLEPTRYTIMQEIVAGDPGTNPDPDPPLLFSALYRFVYSEQQQFSPVGRSALQLSGYPSAFGLSSGCSMGDTLYYPPGTSTSAISSCFPSDLANYVG